MKGRKPKPTALKVLTGNPGKRPLPVNEPVPLGEVQRPAGLSRGACAAWDRVMDAYREAGLVTAVDGPVLGAWCSAVDMHGQANVKVQEEGAVKDERVNPWLTIQNKQAELIAKLGALLGLDPTSRARMCAPAQKPKTGWESFG